ncbi:hypothetical protein BDN72DRAFT_558516 [Pluteus cervinus]|uniref:Uncharacterized protein n=1 Tax=Pluteus cervinus TaxID=181527 RepID=A0ACD3BB93_9AGAR|nr:hypothetical protein BDN72DRAFT_558516 [Pluteus cervinus]
MRKVSRASTRSSRSQNPIQLRTTPTTNTLLVYPAPMTIYVPINRVDHSFEGNPNPSGDTLHKGCQIRTVGSVSLGLLTSEVRGNRTIPRVEVLFDQVMGIGVHAKRILCTVAGLWEIISRTSSKPVGPTKRTGK